MKVNEIHLRDCEKVGNLSQIINEFNPEALFITFLLDDHDDHRRANELLLTIAPRLSVHPKEVWALIALLAYLAILHGRFAGWVGQFGYAAMTVAGFLTVLMAWYGVNFVLGAGLHSYGFADGGAPWVVLFVILQIAYIALAAGVKFKISGTGKAPKKKRLKGLKKRAVKT